MLENLFSTPLLIAYAVMFGVTMKVADLLDEHGLKWFKGSAIIFGFLCGIFGVMLMIGNNTVANLILAMTIALICRNRIDYINHQIAATIIIVSFLFFSTFSPILFLIFYFVFLIFGSIKDYRGDILRNKGGYLSYFLNEAILFYPISTFVYCAIYGNWVVFWIFLLFTTAYTVTKCVGEKYNYP